MSKPPKDIRGTTYYGKPLQRVSYSEKNKDNKAWYRATADWVLSMSSLYNKRNYADGQGGRDIRELYQVYNSQIPAKWFSHITNPLGSSNPNHTAWPAKIRPLNILRTNLDLLANEWEKRPMPYTVVNLGEAGYNEMMDQMQKQVSSNLKQQFDMIAAREAVAQGVPEDQLQEYLQQNPPQYPGDVVSAFKASYKDNLAMKAQDWLDRAVIEEHFVQKWKKMFLDWLIAGEVYSFKGIRHKQLDYRRISPIAVDYEKSPDTEFIEDGEWCVALYELTASDVVDMFYEDMKEEEHEILENSVWQTPSHFYGFLNQNYRDSINKVPVYHICWKGRKKIGFMSFQDPETGETHEVTVDEDYIRQPGETIEWRWVNEVYEVWKVGGLNTVNETGIYLQMGPIECQRNEMENASACKLPYNGIRFSDTHANNISVMELGLPYLILFIIVGRSIELTIARSKGKIIMMDKNAIPRGDGWDEEKFFYYSEAHQWALMNRNQIGVDKSFNQYTVMDMTLYDQLKQLIDIQQWIKGEWDAILGISAPRKGETAPSEGLGVAQQNFFQSTVITENIFTRFEDFLERELQGMIDLSRFLNVDGMKRLFNRDAVTTAVLEIDPVKYTNAELGVFVTRSSKEVVKKMKLEGYAQAMIQNGAKPSTVTEIIKADNFAKLSVVLKKIEDAEAEAARAAVDDQKEMQQIEIEGKKVYREFEEILKRQTMHEEYDRKEELEALKGEFNLLTFQGSSDVDKSGVPDALEIMDREEARQNALRDSVQKNNEVNQKTNLERAKLEQKEKSDARKASLEKEKIKSQEKIAKLQAQTALKNKTSGEK